MECISKAPEILEFPKAFDAAFSIQAYRFLDPLWKVKRALNLGSEYRLKQHIAVVNEFVYNVIRNRQRDQEFSLVSILIFTILPFYSLMLSLFG